VFQLLGFLGLDFVGPPPPMPATPSLPGQPTSLANLLALVDLWDWWKGSGYSLDDIAIGIGLTPRKPAAYPDPGPAAQQIVAGASRALTFTDRVFSVALGTSEQGSRDLLTCLSADPPGAPASPLPKSSLLLVQRSATDGSWSIIPGVSPPDLVITTRILLAHR